MGVLRHEKDNASNIHAVCCSFLAAVLMETSMSSFLTTQWIQSEFPAKVKTNRKRKTKMKTERNKNKSIHKTILATHLCGQKHK